MQAAVRQDGTVSRLRTSAWLEHGRDGIDLPLAALVAETVRASPGRALPWVEKEESAGATEGEAETVGYVCVPPGDAILGEECCFVGLSDPWRLDPGWLELDQWAEIEMEATSEDVAPGAGVSVLASRGRTVTIPVDCGGGDPSAPALVILTGGSDLDARDLGDLYGVIVVDEGSVLLDGTILHGAVFVSGCVDLGESGQLLFSRSILRWATDGSLNRARLVPGTRWEGME